MNTKHMRCLNLRTGEVRLVTQREGNPMPSLYEYFNAINILNETADEYGLVYLSVDNVLGDLKEMENSQAERKDFYISRQ